MKKINGKKLLKNFVIALLGAIIGYLLYYSVIMEAIPLFIESSGIKYTVVSILALVILIAGCIAALNLIINKRVNKYLFFTMCVTYFAILFVALFFLRSSIERVFIFNPLTGLIDTFSNWEMAIQSIMNLAVFIPMGYFVRKLKYSNLFIFSIVISLAIELIQVATMRGFFDVFDILLYFIGIHIGYFIFKKWQIIVK